MCKLEYLRDNNPETEITKDLEEKLEYLREKELQRWRSEKTWKKNWNIYGIRNQRSKSEKNIKERLEHLGKQEKFLFGVNYKDIHGQHTKLSATNIMFVHVLLS